MARKGETWNESETYRDALTLRQVRRITRRGLINNTPTYHTGTTFTEDGAFFAFASTRDGGSAVMLCETATGDITQMTEMFPHAGSLEELHKGGVSIGDGWGVTHLICVAPRSGFVVFVQGRALRAVQMHTGAERTLVPDWGSEWIGGVPSIDPSETSVLLPLMSAHPQLQRGERQTKGYVEWFREGGPTARIMQYPLAGDGPGRVVYEERGIGCAHCPHSPADADLVLLDRDRAPNLWMGASDAKGRVYTLRLSSGELNEALVRNTNKFQMHAGWTWSGEEIFYHGSGAGGGWYIGIAGKEGETRREWHYPKAAYYGHVAAAPNREAILVDGNLTNDTLILLDYAGKSADENPRVEIIARHGTDWGALPFQASHPHPVFDPTGRFISFNRAERGRADVYLLTV